MKTIQGIEPRIVLLLLATQLMKTIQGVEPQIVFAVVHNAVNENKFMAPSSELFLPVACSVVNEELFLKQKF